MSDDLEWLGIVIPDGGSGSCGLGDPIAQPEPTDWRSGSNLIVVECISPFADHKEIVQQFLDRAVDN